MLHSAGGGSDDDGSNDSSEAGSEDSSESGGSSSSSSSSAPRRCVTTKSFSDLKAQLNVFLEEPPRPFRPGDIVVWKEGCANRKRPKIDEPGVILEVMPEPIYGKEKSAGSPYFHEPLDIVIGLLDSDGDLVRYCFDKRRFRLATQPDELKGGVGMSGTQKMRSMALEYAKPLEFHVGDVVMLKPGFRHRRIPDYETVAVVAEILPNPFRDTDAEEGTSSFYELMNGRIAFLDGDGDIAFLHVDLRRYRKVK